MLRRTLTALAFASLSLVGVSGPAAGKAYTLQELLAIARHGNQGILAGGAAATAMEAQVHEARRNWLPSGELTSLLTALPPITCSVTDPFADPLDPSKTVRRDDACFATSADPVHKFSWPDSSWRGWTRTDVKLIQPLFDFGKIAAGVEAAEAGVAALRHKQQGTAYDVDLNVRKAYWGRKLARELLDTLEEGTGYIDEAQKKIDKQLAEGVGNVTVTDRLRLRTVRAEIDARTLETKRLAEFALAGLRTLLGPEAPADLEVDDEPLAPLEIPSRPVSYYEESARLNRPEVHALDYAVKAKTALSVLERRREYPDLALVGTGSFAYAPNVDIPKNAFANNPFNGHGFGLAAVLRMPLDLGPRMARADRMVAEADELGYRRSEALGGIALEVRKAHAEIVEAQARVEAVRKGEKAGKAWVTAVAQNFAIGLAEARDFSDALTAFFQMRARYLQSVFDLNVASAALERATGAAIQ